MDTSLSPTILATFIATTLTCSQVQAEDPGQPSSSPATHYSQKTLLKNWALSVCVATVAKDESTREDANAAASAYLEFGGQPIVAYDPLRR